MVAEATVIARPLIETVGLHTTVFLIFLEKKLHVSYPTFSHLSQERGADKHLVQTPPLSTEPIRALSAVVTTCDLRHIYHAML